MNDEVTKRKDTVLVGLYIFTAEFTQIYIEQMYLFEIRSI